MSSRFFKIQLMEQLFVYSSLSSFSLEFTLSHHSPVLCVTLQFSPTSEHLLLAYGRRHNSLLKSIVFYRETTVPVYTILEVMRNSKKLNHFSSRLDMLMIYRLQVLSVPMKLIQ